MSKLNSTEAKISRISAYARLDSFKKMHVSKRPVGKLRIKEVELGVGT